jgi:hypothetical protein
VNGFQWRQCEQWPWWELVAGVQGRKGVLMGSEQGKPWKPKRWLGASRHSGFPALMLVSGEAPATMSVVGKI